MRIQSGCACTFWITLIVIVCVQVIGGPIKPNVTPPIEDVPLTNSNNQSSIKKPSCDNDVQVDALTNGRVELKSNCSQDLIIEPSDRMALWKEHLIIICTVILAIEILIVLIMIHRWKQLKVTFSKFTCPCDALWFRPRASGISVESQNQRYTAAQIQTIHSPQQEDNYPSIYHDTGDVGQQQQSHPSDSPPTSPERDSPTPGTSGTCRHATHPGFDPEYSVRYSNVGSVDSDDTDDLPVSPIKLSYSLTDDANETCT